MTVFEEGTFRRAVCVVQTCGSDRTALRLILVIPLTGCSMLECFRSVLRKCSTCMKLCDLLKPMTVILTVGLPFQ